MTKLIAQRARLIVSAVVGLSVAVSSAPAYAVDVDQVAFTIPTPWLPVIAGLVTNLGVSLATKLRSRPIVKAVTALVFVAVSSVIQNVMAHDGVFVLEDELNIFIVAFVVHLAWYYGLVRHTTIPEELAPDAGLGRPVVPTAARPR